MSVSARCTGSNDLTVEGADLRVCGEYWQVCQVLRGLASGGTVFPAKRGWGIRVQRRVVRSLPTETTDPLAHPFPLQDTRHSFSGINKPEKIRDSKSRYKRRPRGMVNTVGLSYNLSSQPQDPGLLFPAWFRDGPGLASTPLRGLWKIPLWRN